MYPTTPSTSSSFNPYSVPLGSASASGSTYNTPNKRSHPLGSDSNAVPITRSRTLFYLSVRDSAGPSTWDRPSPSSRPSRSKRGGARGGQAGEEQYGARNDVGEEEERLIGGSGDGDEDIRGGRKGKGKAVLPPRW